MIPGKWFQRKRSGKKTHTKFPITNWGRTPILIDMVGVYPRNIHIKFEANLCNSLREAH